MQSSDPIATPILTIADILRIFGYTKDADLEAHLKNCPRHFIRGYYAEIYLGSPAKVNAIKSNNDRYLLNQIVRAIQTAGLTIRVGKDRRRKKAEQPAEASAMQLPERCEATSGQSSHTRRSQGNAQNEKLQQAPVIQLTANASAAVLNAAECTRIQGNQVCLGEKRSLLSPSINYVAREHLTSGATSPRRPDSAQQSVMQRQMYAHSLLQWSLAAQQFARSQGPQIYLPVSCFQGQSMAAPQQWHSVPSQSGPLRLPSVNRGLWAGISLSSPYPLHAYSSSERTLASPFRQFMQNPHSTESAVKESFSQNQREMPVRPSQSSTSEETWSVDGNNQPSQSFKLPSQPRSVTTARTSLIGNGLASSKAGSCAKPSKEAEIMVRAFSDEVEMPAHIIVKPTPHYAPSQQNAALSKKQEIPNQGKTAREEAIAAVQAYGKLWNVNGEEFASGHSRNDLPTRHSTNTNRGLLQQRLTDRLSRRRPSSAERKQTLREGHAHSFAKKGRRKALRSASPTKRALDGQSLQQSGSPAQSKVSRSLQVCTQAMKTSASSTSSHVDTRFFALLQAVEAMQS